MSRTVVQAVYWVCWVQYWAYNSTASMPVFMGQFVPVYAIYTGCKSTHKQYHGIQPTDDAPVLAIWTARNSYSSIAQGSQYQTSTVLVVFPYCIFKV